MANMYIAMCPPRSLVLALMAVSQTVAGDVSGNILITKRLTRKRVEPVASAYHRGAAVAPAAVADDFVTLEREKVAVYIEDIKDSMTTPVTVELGQKNRRFSPELAVIPAGSAVSFPNYDPLFHNVFSLSKAKPFDLGNYPQNQTRVVTFKTPGVVPVFCHLHPNMSAVVVVTPSRWAEKPGPNGEFTMRGVPPGRHTVVAWHRSAGYFRKQIDVPASGEIRLDFIIPVDPSGGPK